MWSLNLGTEKQWLIIYDNVENFSLLADYVPRSTASNSRILIITRYRWVARGITGLIKKFELGGFKIEQSVQLFNRIRKHHADTVIPEGEEEAIETLVRDLDGLILGIEQMAAHIGSQGYSMAEFMEKYNSTTKRLFKQQDHQKDDTNLTNYTLLTLWELDFCHLDGKDAQKLLALLSLLSNETSYALLFSPNHGGHLASDYLFCCDETK